MTGYAAAAALVMATSPISPPRLKARYPAASSAPAPMQPSTPSLPREPRRGGGRAAATAARIATVAVRATRIGRSQPSSSEMVASPNR